MRILSRYVLAEHIRPFLFSLIIITFVLIMDFIITVLDLVISKGIDVMTMLEFFMYNIAWMVALSAPMAVLVATLMAFGRLSGDNEITAIKTSGTNLYRIVLPVLAASALLAAGLIVFNDRVLPEFNYRSKNLKSAIARKKPALALKPGVFLDDFPGYRIQVGAVDQKTSELEDITIYDYRDRRFPATIVARHGHLRFSPDGSVLTLELRDGEMHEIDDKTRRDYRRVTFDRHQLNIPDPGRELNRNTTARRGDREMTVAMMNEKVRENRDKLTLRRKKLRAVVADDVMTVLDEPLTYKRRRQIANRLATNAAAVRNGIRQRDKYLVEIHKKFSIPVACIVFVLVGAPLGIMARRGGIAVGVGLGLGFFIVYWAFLVGGEDLADRGILQPWLAMWGADILIGAAGLYLLILSVRETRFIDWSRILAPFKARGTGTGSEKTI